jgi:hypothetical protein
MCAQWHETTNWPIDLSTDGSYIAPLSSRAAVRASTIRSAVPDGSDGSGQAVRALSEPMLLPCVPARTGHHGITESRTVRMAILGAQLQLELRWLGGGAVEFSEYIRLRSHPRIGNSTAAGVCESKISVRTQASVSVVSR